MKTKQYGCYLIIFIKIMYYPMWFLTWASAADVIVVSKSKYKMNRLFLFCFSVHVTTFIKNNNKFLTEPLCNTVAPSWK